jgi:hypothetical protein
MRRAALAPLLALLACAHRPAAPPPPSRGEALVFDLGRDFSLAANPNGPWRYGYTRGTELRRSEVESATEAVATPPIGFWHAGRGGTGYYPYVAANLGAATAAEPTRGWAARPGEAALEASQVGQLAVVQFTVPRDGRYTISADFAGIHKRLSSTDVHVLLGDEPLFSAAIEGYGGDPAFFPRQGLHPAASYRATRSLRTGDVLTFAVGPGANRTHFNDTTGLLVTIRSAD